MNNHEIDKQLIRRVKAGDKHAFDLIVAKYQHCILRLVVRYVSDPSIAADIAQESFLKAYRSLPNFREECTFFTWLYRISLNTAKSHCTKSDQKTMKQSNSFDETKEYSKDDCKISQFSEPEELAITSEMHQAMLDAVDTLPDDLRTVLLLREIEQLSYNEIADILSCPVGTVRSRLSRARDGVVDVVINRYQSKR